ncbi:MAG: hypothetical protein AAGA48_07390 [Myxococcota bacterium]
MASLLSVWGARIAYPFDLEWMEGGMLAHAWRLQRGEPLYLPPNAEFFPFLYPPGYSALVAFVGTFVGLAPAVGRGLSILGTLASAGAIGFAVSARGGRPVLAWGAAATWLGTYPQTGAFFDLVRPDAVGVGALAWAVTLALRPRRGADIACGLLVVLASLVKHNLGLVAVPLFVAFGLRDVRSALRFAGVILGVGGLVGGMLEWRTEGRFLTYLLDVPRSHPLVWSRAVQETPWELSKALATPLVVVAGAVLVTAVQQRGRLPRIVVGGVPVWAGLLAGWWATSTRAPGHAGTTPFGLGVTVAALVAMAFALVFLAVGRRWGGRGTVAPDVVLASGVVAVLSVGSTLMRVHDGGFANVQMPMFWAWSLLFGLVLAELDAYRSLRPGLDLAVALTLATAVQRLPAQALTPTTEDVATGEAFVEALQDIEGPVLSPFAAWLPTYAGHPPSLHAMAAWDCQHPHGPFYGDLARLDEAIRQAHWSAVLGGNHALLVDQPFAGSYTAGPLIARPRQAPMRPKSGFPAMPIRVLTPVD